MIQRMHQPSEGKAAAPDEAAAFKLLSGNVSTWYMVPLNPAGMVSSLAEFSPSLDDAIISVLPKGAKAANDLLSLNARTDVGPSGRSHGMQPVVEYL